MNRAFHKIVLLALFTLLLNASYSQTLYWVGGSGNFNDPKHWSLRSGGQAAFRIPDNTTDVFFDDNSGEGQFTVNFDKNNSVKSFNANSLKNAAVFDGSKLNVLYVSEGIYLSQFVRFNSQAEIIFNSPTLNTHLVEFGLNTLNCNLYFNHGNYTFRSITQNEQNTINFGDGNYTFNRAVLTTGNFVSTNPSAVFNIDRSFFKATNFFKIDQNATVNSNKFYLVASQTSTQKFSAPSQLLSAPSNTFVNMMMPICSLTINTTPSCQGPCTGVLTISFSPGCTDNPYSIFVNNGDPSCAATTASLAGTINTATSSVYTAPNACTCSINYQVLVFDQLGNFANQNINFIPNPISATNNNTIASCSYLCDGKMTGNIFGSPVFSVAVTPNTVTPASFTTAFQYTLNNLCGGVVYTLTITDKDGCVGAITKTLAATPPVLPNAITNSVLCFNACNGTISVNPTGGSPGYTVGFGAPISTTYTVPAAGSASAGGLCPGAYSSTVTDTKGCTVTTNYNITQPTSITVVPTQTNLLCNAVCNGQASVGVSGGTPPYFYTWSPSTSTTNVASALCAGTQTVSILDNNACPRTQTFNITSPPAITLTLTKRDVTCFNQCNGSVTVTAAGGVAPHTFTWTGPAPFVTTTGSVITNLCPGVYTLNAVDNNTCASVRTIQIVQPPQPSVTVNVVNNTCFSSCAGSATVTITGSNGAPFQYTWTPGVTAGQGQGTATLNSLCQGSYTLAAVDASACPIGTVITITQPSSITPNVTTASLNCNAVCIGSIGAAASGGSGAPYTYTLFTPIPSQIVGNPPYTNLCAGVYTLAVRDVSNCVSNTTINIAQPSPLVPSIAASSVSCFNACNGSLAGNVVGGSPGYTLTWATPSGPAAGGNLVNQCAGNYTFFVVDSKSCTAQTTFTLLQPADITATFNITPPTCNTSCNGQITTNLSGGTPGYTLNWSNSGGNPNINLCNGVYTLTVNDLNNCIKIFTAGVVAPPAFTISVVTKSTVCAGDCNGSATVTAAGGTGLLTYQLNSPVVTNTTGIFTGLCAGAYIVNVTDANGCTTPIGFNISAPPLLTAAITGVVNTCNICTGAATVTIGGGVPGYTVTWTNSVSATVGTGTSIAGLCVGNYTASVLDANGCVRTATVSIANSVSVSVVTAGNAILCFGACNASATANPSGGTPPYTYTWNAVPTQTTQTATGLCAGGYTVTVVDFIGCSNTGTILFTQPSSITVTSSQTNIPCFGGCVGAITTTASGGAGSYSYSWSPGGQTTSSLTSLCTGTYSIKVTDLNGCTLTPATFSVVSNTSLNIAFTSTTPSGCNLSNGVISATASGGSGAGYSFTWTPPSTSVVAGPVTTATGLGAGTYTLRVIDGAGCTNSFVTSLSNPAGPVVNVSSTTITCFGGANGSATATATGAGPFTFTWAPATASTVSGATTTASGLLTGTYNISVTDMATGCITTQSIGILQPTQMTITSNVTNASCNTSNNGSITATVAGGTPNYTLNWLPAGTGTAITGLSPGNYTVNINDANGCTMTRTFVIIAPGALTVTSTQTNVSCNSGTNGAISLTVTGGTAAYTFTWVPVGPFPGSAANSVNGLAPNVYTVNIADANGCPISGTYTITQPTALAHTVTTTNAVCNSSCTGTASQTVTGGTPTYSFSWSSSAATTPSLGALCAGNYTANVVDGNGCISSRTFAITQPAAIAITITPTNPKCNAVCNGSITTNITGGNGGYAYSWAPAGAGPNPTGLCAGNYTLSITDASLCPGSAVITLTNPPSIVANITFSNPACNAFCNGSATATPANALSPIQYTWTTAPSQSAPTATGLCAGTYSVFILDNNGCTDTGVVTLTNPPLLNVNVSILAASCGSANGTASVSPSGGTPTYTFAWTPAVAGNTNVATNLFAGIYTVSVTDFNGCNNVVSIAVGNSGGATVATIGITTINCNGQCTGGATVTAAAGSSATPYAFSWVSPPSANTVNPQSNLCVGTYTARIADNNGCLYFQSVNITQPPALNDNETVTNAFCIGVCSGNIVLAPTGGTGPYAYAWSPSPSTTNTANSLCVGVHTATITDNLGCLFTATYNVNGTTILTSAIASSSNPCFGNCIGSATVTASGGGLAPYSYAWNNSQNGVIANNLCNGTYSVIVTDNNGCQNTFTTGITSPAALAVAPTVSAPSCGMCNGSATVVTGGGTTPFTYSWTSTGTSSVEPNLCAGLYQVIVTDANGCSLTQNIPISSSTTMTEVYNVQDELCAGGCNGQVTVTPSGGTSPYTFAWINPVSTNSVLGSLCSGVYFVQITDSLGCVRTSSVAVGASTNIAINASVQQPSCGMNTGTITVSPTGGSGSYTVSWLPAGSGTIITGPAGIYTVSITDGNCTQTTAINLNNSTAPAIFFTVANNGCSTGPCAGSVVATPTLGTGPYDFTWSTGSFATNVASHSVTGLCAGVITLTVTDANGCMAFQSFTITQNPILNLSLPVVTQIRCNNDCNGAIQLIPSGGALPYTITWIPASTITPANPLTNLCAGSYTGIVTDVNGCVLTRTVDILNPLPFTFSAQVTDATCNSSTDGAISATVSGATPAYTYTWTDAAANTYTTAGLTNVLPGTYSLSILDAQGCAKDTVVTINGSFTVVANASPDMTLCTTPNPILLDGSASVNGQTYNWTQLSPSVTVSNSVTANVLPAVGSNSYVLLVTSSVAICFDTDMVVINVNPLPSADAGPTQSISLFTTANLGGSPTSLTGTSFTWTPSNGLNDPNSANPVTSTTVSTQYTVFVMDGTTGCVNTSTVDIFIYPDIKIPNGFSPNSDGRNDTWIIDNIQQFTECTVEIYNRWGELLFVSAPGYPKPWDGIYHGKPLPVGTYYYIIDLKHDAYPKPYTGPLTIFR
jgi:gliding motility-associated-like protein